MFSKIVGQDKALEGLTRRLKDGRVASAYLFAGPDGVGKKTAALDMVRSVLCERREGTEPCGSCPSCSVTSSFVELHSSVMLFEDVLRPWAYRRDSLMRVSGYAPHEHDEYLAGMAVLAESDLVEFSPSASKAEDQIDVLVRNPEALFDKQEAKAISLAAIDRSIELIKREISDGDDQRPYRLAESLFRHLSAGLYHGTAKILLIRNVLQQRLANKPLFGTRHICIIDDAHNMQEAAQNCLLKTLEEPPLGSVIILVTDNPSVLLPTILSRCQTVNFQRLATETIQDLLAAKRGLSEETARSISSFAAGSLGKAMSVSPDDFMHRQAMVNHIIDFVLSGKMRYVFSCVDEVLLEAEKSKAKKRKWALELLDMLSVYLRDAIVFWESGMLETSLSSDGSRVQKLGETFSAAELMQISDHVDRAREKIEGNADVRLALEAMLLNGWLERIGPRPVAS